jgi:hypothetical protein
VNADCNKLAPTNSVSSSHHGDAKCAGITLTSDR